MSKRKRLRKLLTWFLILITAWLVFAQCSFKFRISDAEATSKFSKAGVSLKTETVVIDDFKIHFAQTGNDSLSTLFFVHGSPGGWNAFEKDPAY